MDLQKSRFTEHLVWINALQFRRWVFEPGMAFFSETKWWGDRGCRDHRHIGLDIRTYETYEGTVDAITGHTNIPLMYEGRIVKSIKDFLGITLFAAHEVFEGNSQLFTIYGHVLQTADIVTDKVLSEGTKIASLAGTADSKVPPHLHLSVALIPKSIPLETVTWKILTENNDILFFDPRDLI